MTLDSAASQLLRIRHRTRYLYHFPVSFEPHRLVVRPREGHDLRVESLTLLIEPQATIVWPRDILGNSIAHAHFESKATELLIEADVTLRRFFYPAEPPHTAHSLSGFHSHSTNGSSVRCLRCTG